MERLELRGLLFLQSWVIEIVKPLIDAPTDLKKPQLCLMRDGLEVSPADLEDYSSARHPVALFELIT